VESSEVTELREALRRRLSLNLREFRTARGMTQNDLAEASGVGRTFINQLERGHVSVSLDNLAGIAAALDVSPHSLLDNIDWGTATCLLMSATRRPRSAAHAADRTARTASY